MSMEIEIAIHTTKGRVNTSTTTFVAIKISIFRLEVRQEGVREVQTLPKGTIKGNHNYDEKCI